MNHFPAWVQSIESNAGNKPALLVIVFLLVIACFVGALDSRFIGEISYYRPEKYAFQRFQRILIIQIDYRRERRSLALDAMPAPILTLWPVRRS